MISFSIEALLRPYPEAVNPAGSVLTGSYQGDACTRPIMFTEGGIATDELAGQPGYSARLARALPVPMGARIILWLPTIPVLDDQGVAVAYYRWMIAWRLRSAQEAQASATAGAFHMGSVVGGVAETGPNAGARYGRPAAWQTLTYVPAEPAPTPPTAIGNRAVSSLHPEDVFAGAGVLAQPRLPGTSALAQVQQGVIDPSSTVPPGINALANMPAWIPHEVVALGDELLVGCYREATADANWDFTAGHADRLFGHLFAAQDYPQMGVRVFCGSIG